MQAQKHLVWEETEDHRVQSSQFKQLIFYLKDQEWDTPAEWGHPLPSQNQITQDNFPE